MRDSAPALAYTSILLLGGALGGVIYLGTRAGPSTSSGSPAAAASSSATSAPETAPTAGSVSTAAPGELTFIPSADLTAEEQAVLERLNQVRANPPAFFGEWKAFLAKERTRGLSCEEPDSMLDPLKSYAPKMPLAANQQLTNAARTHAKDELKRGFTGHVNPDGIGSNQRVIAAGYPLPIGARVGGFTYSAEKNAVNTEALFVAAGNITYGPSHWLDVIDALVVDACVPSRGHRDHMLGVGGTSPLELEIGIGGVIGSSPRNKNEMQVVIETATRNDGKFYVLGVVYRDSNANNRYDIGEGVPSVQITIADAGVTTKSAPGGGYALPVSDGLSAELTTGGGAKLPFAIKGANVKLDVKIP
ncbi:MAG: CAP domain-containing protein [Deltaproteobacteria bacterium]|nr:CAP domain-containing protein [Deltaproteobacteria bacterium]